MQKARLGWCTDHPQGLDGSYWSGIKPWSLTIISSEVVGADLPAGWKGRVRDLRACDCIVIAIGSGAARTCGPLPEADQALKVCLWAL